MRASRARQIPNAHPFPFRSDQQIAFPIIRMDVRSKHADDRQGSRLSRPREGIVRLPVLQTILTPKWRASIDGSKGYVANPTTGLARVPVKNNAAVPFSEGFQQARPGQNASRSPLLNQPWPAPMSEPMPLPRPPMMKKRFPAAQILLAIFWLAAGAIAAKAEQSPINQRISSKAVQNVPQAPAPQAATQA